MSTIPPELDAGAPGNDEVLDYRRLRACFEQALDVPVSEREAWLQSQPLTPAQRAHVRRLLEADDSNQGFLETPPLDRAARIGDAEGSDDGRSLIGQRIGGFRLKRMLGRGGMAIVFLAERESSDFRQQVAVKLLRRGLYSELEQRLFQRERRVLAALSHPNIARLIDGGVTDAGIPYLVMDYVDGASITRHAAERRLGVSDRLTLFVRICNAVAAAHQHLIVHRDLKPSNILVDASGEVKLLDFGIAKLLDEDPGPATGTGLPVLTPGYAAPEQYAGGPISTATDVYALGVLLHELLVGERPADPPRRPSTQIAERSVAAAQLPLSLPALRSALGGDLDNIVLKALEAEPARRYASARDLGDDIERHLDGRPVAAHPPSRWYRARKFVARHRGSVLITALFAAAILAALGITLWQADVARQQAQRAAEVQAFLEQLFEPIERGSALAEAPSLPELLRRGRERIDERYPDNPEVRADLLAMFARISDGAGETSNNRALAEAAWRANSEAFGADDERTLQARSLYAAVLRKLGDYDASLAELEAVRTVMLAQGAQGLAYARLLDSISMTLMEQGIDPMRAIALKREALRLREADPNADAEEVTTAYNNLGAAYQYARDYPQARYWYERALERDRARNGDSLGTATTLMNIGQVETFAGRWREGAATLREARAMFARIPIARHPNLVSLLIRLCGVESDLEDPSAEATCADAVDMARDVHGETHAQYAYALTRAARAHLAAGDAVAAERAALSQLHYAFDAPEPEKRAVLRGWAEWYGQVKQRFDYPWSERLRILFLDTRFATYWSNLVRLDFGISLTTRQPVLETLVSKLRYTLSLSVASLLLAYIIAVPLGIFSAVRRDTRADRVLTVALFMLYSLPSFFVATLLLFFFSEGSDWVALRLFPTGGFQSPDFDDLTSVDQIGDVLWHLVLPVGCLTYGSLAALSRYMRTGLLEVIQSDYIRTARAKGLPERLVIGKHALRNGLLPIITLLASQLPAALGGSVVIEYIFGIPGIGQWTIASIYQRDYTVIMGVQLLTTVVVLFGMLLSDIGYALVDPRIRYH